MIKGLILKIVLPLLVVTAQVFSDADGPGCYKVQGVASSDVLWMHTASNWKSKKIEKIPYNGIVQYTDREHGVWMKVIYNKKVGWVNGKYLKESYCKEEIKLTTKTTDLSASSMIHEFMKYSEARKLLINKGWKIVINRENNNELGFETRLIDINGWKELSACSGTGLGFCSFEFKKNSDIFHVTTAGDCIDDKNGKRPKDDEMCELLVYGTNTYANPNNQTSKVEPTLTGSKPLSFITLNPSSHNDKILKAVTHKEAWTRSPLLLTLHIIGDDTETRSVSIEVVKNSAESANAAKVIYTRDGFLDDSVRGDWHQLNLIRLADGTWRIESLYQASSCWRFENSEVYQDKICT